MIRPKVAFSSKNYVRELAIFDRMPKGIDFVFVAAVGKKYTFDYHTNATHYIYICTAWQAQASHALDRLKWSPS